MNIIDYAYLYAERGHKDQFRRYTKQPYIVHPTRVADRIRAFTQTDWVIAAALLHDILEDTNTSHRDLCRDFNSQVADLVLEVTNESKQFASLPRAKRKELDRLHLSRASYHGKMIKILDRIDNLTDLYGNDPKFEKLYAEESKLLVPILSDCPSFLVNELNELIERML